jgi:hypothetical protein
MRPFLRYLALVVPLATGCGSSDPSADDAPLETTDEALAAPVFHRSDQVHFGRAPMNTDDVSHEIDIADDFSNGPAAASRAIAWAKAHPASPRPMYLGGIHTWLFDTDAGYRARVEQLASKVAAATNKTLLLYFEEENASHAPHPVSAANAGALRNLASHVVLLCATYVNGQMSHPDEVATVQHWKTWYHGRLGVPLTSMWIDVDLSQTPTSQYYGSRGDLAEFNKAVGWTLTSAYANGFGGFHTFGNVGGSFGTLRAADSTYHALNAAWDALVKAHPQKKFEGT